MPSPAATALISSIRPDLAANTHTEQELENIFAAAAATTFVEPGDHAWGQAVAATDTWSVFDAFTNSKNSQEFISKLNIATDTDRLAQQFDSWQSRYSESGIDKAFQLAAAEHLTFIDKQHPHYPKGLRDLGDAAPGGLWARGNTALLASPRAVSIVGARAATEWGEIVAGELAGDLTYADLVIVSGGAYGIDGAAHRAALKHQGKTIAYLASGLDRLYPSGHAELLRNVAEHGVIVSEMPPGTNPSKYRFLQRNRLIAAHSPVSVVVEAGIRSGSLNEAGHALLLGRTVAAVPGSENSAASNGSNQLIADGNAQPVRYAENVLALMPATAPVDSNNPNVDPVQKYLHSATGIQLLEKDWKSQAGSLDYIGVEHDGTTVVILANTKVEDITPSALARVHRNVLIWQNANNAEGPYRVDAINTREIGDNQYAMHYKGVSLAADGIGVERVVAWNQNEDAGFWPQIQNQLDRISQEQPDTFDKVKQILDDPIYGDIKDEIDRNGARTFDADNTFFAGSGGDNTLRGALWDAGWKTVTSNSRHHYAMQHARTGETLTYTEGDLARGNTFEGVTAAKTMPVQDPELASEITAPQSVNVAPQM